MNTPIDPTGLIHDARRIGPRTVQFSGSDLARDPLQGISVMPWGMLSSSNILHLQQVPTTDTPVSKVGPLFARNNPKGPYLHEKPSNVIITNPLMKPINREGEGERGVRHQRERNQRVRASKRETKSKLAQEDQLIALQVRIFTFRIFLLQDIHTSTIISKLLAQQNSQPIN